MVHSLLVLIHVKMNLLETPIIAIHSVQRNPFMEKTNKQTKPNKTYAMLGIALL